MKDIRIIIDGDSCPVIKIIENISIEYNIRAILFCSYNHVPNQKNNMEYFIVDSSPQAVDLAIINSIEDGDIVVTQDYGLASIVLSKGAKAISPRGNIYSNASIDILLYNRHLNNEIRKSGGKMKGNHKRTKNDDTKFKNNLIKLIKNI